MRGPTRIVKEVGWVVMTCAVLAALTVTVLLGFPQGSRQSPQRASVAGTEGQGR